MTQRISGRCPVRLFVTDIDGCLSEPYRPYRLDGLAELRALAAGAKVDADPVLQPALSICSGRAYPYVEAMTQLLGLETPVVFEAGGGMFDPVASRWQWHPDFSDDLSRQIVEVRAWLLSEIVPGTSLDLDHAKKTQASLAGPIVEDVMRAVPVVEEHVDTTFPELLVAHTHISIEIIPRALNKAAGMRWLADEVGVFLAEIAFIGDTNGDIPALDIVGYAFAPANATPAVKETAHITTNGPVIDGVLEAYRWCAGRNDLLATGGL